MPLDGLPERVFDFSDPDLYNPVYIPLFGVKHRFLHLYGSAGSGKSVFAAQREIVLSFEHYRRNRKTLVARRFYNTLGNSCYSELKNVVYEWGLEKHFRFTRSPYSIVNLETNVEFVFIGLDDVEKIKSIRGADRGWLEEATEVKTIKELRQLGLRLRGFREVQWTLSYNPVSVHHWLNTEIHEKRPREHYIQKTTYLDNVKLLSIQPDYADYIESLKNEDPNYFRVYGLGMWGEARDGLIYPAYETVAEMPTTPQAYGADFGYNDPCALAAIALEDVPGKERKNLYWDERLYETKLNSTDLVRRCDELKISKKIPIIADSNWPSYIADLRAAGYWVIEAQKEKGSVNIGINAIKKYNLCITAGSKNIFKEIQNYSWKNKNGRWLDETAGMEAEAQDGVDHLMDAVRYATRYLTNPISSGSLEFEDRY